MKTSVDCDHLLELIPAYSIGATDDDETRLIEASLGRCPEAAAALADYRAAALQLAQTVPQHTPPPELLDNLLAAARQTPKVTRRHLPRGVWRYAAAACLVLAIGTNNLYWLARISDIERRMVAFDAAQVLYLPPAVNGLETAASARVVWQTESGEAVLLASNFPAHPADTRYQAWVRRGTQITSLGLFQVDDGGDGTLRFPAALVAGTFDGLGVTLEPLNGSPRSTSPPVVRWQANP